MPLDWLTHKRKFRLLVLADPKALTISERVVYSYLAHRAFYGKTATQTEIAGRTGLDRGTAVARAVENLERKGLAQRHPDGVQAIEPTCDLRPLFVPIDGGEHWSQSYAYIWYYPAQDGITTAQNVLLWTLASVGERPQNKAGLAKLLGVTRETVQAAVIELTHQRAISFKPDGQRFRCGLLEPQAGWFIDRPKKPGSRLAEQLQALLGKAGIPAYEHHEFINDLVRMPDPVAVLKIAFKGHQQWCEKNNITRPTHCGKRLRMEIDRHKNLEAKS